MPQLFSSRDNVKRDPLQERVEQLLEWIAANRQTFFFIVGTAAIALVVGAFVFASFRNLREQAWQKYAEGQNWLYGNRPDQALTVFNDVISNYSRTPAAVYALISKGDLLYAQKKPKEAAEAYQECVNKGPERIILPFVLASLGAAQEDQGDFNAAISTYKKLLSEFPDHFLAPKAYESLARSYEMSKNPDAAKEVYEKVITMYPGTLWADKARVRYQTLSPQPFQMQGDDAFPAQKGQ